MVNVRSIGKSCPGSTVKVSGEIEHAVAGRLVLCIIWTVPFKRSSLRLTRYSLPTAMSGLVAESVLVSGAIVKSVVGVGDGVGSGDGREVGSDVGLGVVGRGDGRGEGTTVGLQSSQPLQSQP